jgi:soluble lytic murein transglycosylase-like protein
VQIPNELAAVLRRIAEITGESGFGGAPFGAAVKAASSAPRAAIDRCVLADSRAEAIDPALIEAIIANESGFDSRATSRAGARGLMQLMPQTAASLGVVDPYDVAQNVRGGTKYLRELLDCFGDVELAVAAYNAGPAAVERYGGVPPYAETRRYVRSVMARYRELQSPRAGVLNSATLR